jgi:two-component system, cell cycle sensor histidine kinase and response regulator CckA
VGYTVLEAQDGIEALSLASGEATIDLVVTDMIMPRMGGRELAKAIRSKRPDVRFLYMSGYDSESEITGPGEAFIQKPFSITEFSQAVRDILKS